jgi:ABC-type lipoprotein release transport system permease subunit
MTEAFRLGGWGMYPTLICGILLIGAGILYAVKPQRRFVPLLISVGTMTFVSGLLGFTTGVIKSFLPIGQVGPGERYIAMIGVAESMVNITFALVFVMLAAIGASIGAARIAHSLPQEARGEEAAR